MLRLAALSSDHEALGQTIIGYKDAIGSEEFTPFFAKHGLGQIDPNRWYSYQAFLDTLRDITEAPGSMMNFVSIGMKIGETAVFPSGTEKLPFATILGLINEANRLNTRGSDIGNIKLDPVTEREIKLTIRGSLPDDVTYGIIYAFGRRFLPHGTSFDVFYDAKAPRRDHGADTTTIHVRWE